MGEVVINEIHYDSDPKTDAFEFVELHNAGGKSIDLSGWHFSDGIKYTFPANTNLCLLYTSPSPRDRTRSRMPSSA